MRIHLRRMKNWSCFLINIHIEQETILEFDFSGCLPIFSQHSENNRDCIGHWFVRMMHFGIDQILLHLIIKYRPS